MTTPDTTSKPCPECARKDALLKEASLETDGLIIQIREALGCEDGEAIAWAIGRLRADVKLKDAQLAALQKDRERLDWLEIRETPSLDRIEVFWRNHEPGKGSVTIICYGSAWTAYFGGMSGRTVQQFFADADTDYLVTKLGITPQLKQRKSDHAYLGRIIDAVKGALRETMNK